MLHEVLMESKSKKEGDSRSPRHNPRHRKDLTSGKESNEKRRSVSVDPSPRQPRKALDAQQLAAKIPRTAVLVRSSSVGMILKFSIYQNCNI
jgi:hypothetical protein